jgi:hypothetical protein
MQNHSQILYRVGHILILDKNCFCFFLFKNIYLFEENKSAKHGRFLWIAFEEMGEKYFKFDSQKYSMWTSLFPRVKMPDLESDLQIPRDLKTSWESDSPCLGSCIKYFCVWVWYYPVSDPPGFDNAQNLFPRSLIISESDPLIYIIYHKEMCSHNEEKQAEKQ